MIKRLIFFFRAVLVVIVTFIDSIIILLIMLLSGKNSYFHKYARMWSRQLLAIAGVKVIVTGLELLPTEDSFVLISNHASLFDIPILLGNIDRKLVIMYKRELERIPIFGWGLRLSPFVAVNRSAAREAMSSLEEAAALITGNISVIIFPEGSRSKDGTLGEFRRGAFKVALLSRKPIVIAAIAGSSNILPSGKLSFKPGEVKLKICKVVTDYEVNTRAEEKAFIEDAKRTIAEAIAK